MIVVDGFIVSSAVLVAAREGGLQVATVGLGSNLLAADDGVDMLVLHLAGELVERPIEAHIRRHAFPDAVEAVIDLRGRLNDGIERHLKGKKPLWQRRGR